MPVLFNQQMSLPYLIFSIRETNMPVFFVIFRNMPVSFSPETDMPVLFKNMSCLKTGKAYGTQGNKIGNAHLKWAFSEAAVLFLKGNPPAQAYLAKLQKRMSKAKALSALAHKLGRCMYFMLKNQTVFDSERFLAG